MEKVGVRLMLGVRREWIKGLGGECEECREGNGGRVG